MAYHTYFVRSRSVQKLRLAERRSNMLMQEESFLVVHELSTRITVRTFGLRWIGWQENKKKSEKVTNIFRTMKTN